MTKNDISLLKTGLLSILCYLRTNHEARFGELALKLGVPPKTIALRLIELRNAGFVTRKVRQEGVDGVGYHVYVLTETGLRLIDRLGAKPIERLMEVERELHERVMEVERELRSADVSSTGGR